jgi:hypothetical protein
MHTLALMIQTAAPDIGNPASWGALGVGGLLAAGMFYFYREDRKRSEAAYAQMIADFRAIIEANTEAMTSLREAIRERD